jgi:hypothetical protein
MNFVQKMVVLLKHLLVVVGGDCSRLKLDHVSVLVMKDTWIPDILDGLYECQCRLSCLWTRNDALADQHDVVLYQNVHPPETTVNALDTLDILFPLNNLSRKKKVHENQYIITNIWDDHNVIFFREKLGSHLEPL